MKLPKDTETQILVESRRRCCICYGLVRDSDIKRGQIAHLDHDPNNNQLDNLAFLCFDHHDEYDSRRSQSKGFTRTEVKVFRAELQEALAAALRAPFILKHAEVDEPAWPGLYRWEGGNSSAELELSSCDGGTIQAVGLALWGTRNANGPNMGVLDVQGIVTEGKVVLKQGDHVLELTHISGGLEAKALTPSGGEFGANVTFEGTYGRVPHGAAVLPQPPLRPFESEFWPEEGRPVFVTKVDQVPVHARPTTDAPIISTLCISQGQELTFNGFRYRTVRPGTVLATQGSELTGRNLGQTDYVSHSQYYDGGGEQVSFRMRPGDELEYLQYRAEGGGFVRWQGLTIDMDMLPWFGSSPDLRLITSPVAQSWILISSSAGPGWVLADEFLVEVRRDF